MDRFMLKMSLGYPSEDEENELLSRRVKWMTDDPTGYAMTVTNADELLAIRQFIEAKVRVDQDIIKYILAFRVIRDDERVAAGPSPRVYYRF